MTLFSICVYENIQPTVDLKSERELFHHHHLPSGAPSSRPDIKEIDHMQEARGADAVSLKQKSLLVRKAFHRLCLPRLSNL